MNRGELYHALANFLNAKQLEKAMFLIDTHTECVLKLFTKADSSTTVSLGKKLKKTDDE